MNTPPADSPAAVLTRALERALPVLRRAAAAEPVDRLSGYKSPAAIAVDEAEAALHYSRVVA